MPKIVVLVSGGGSNLQSIIDQVESGNLKLEITKVIADRPAYALERAKNHNIEAVLVDRKLYKGTLSKEIDKHIPSDTDLIVCAGYLSIITKEFTSKWENKIINIHPSLLPKYGGKGMYGLNVHRAVIEAGEKESGCTLHYVNSGIDTGDIISFAKVEVLENDSPIDLQKRVLEQEHSLMVEGIKNLLCI